MARIFLVALALGAATLTSAVALERHPGRDARMNGTADASGGCGPNHHRGVGGNCVLNPTKGPYRPDPYWTPCDYSLGPAYPEGCAE